MSVAIVHHPSRAALLDVLLDRLGAGRKGRLAGIAADTGQGPTATSRAAWEMADTSATHHLVLEDDAIPVPDLLPALERIVLPNLPIARSAVSLFGIAGRYRKAWNDGACFYVDNGTNWAQALILPTSEIPAFLAWNELCVRPDYRWWCQRLTVYCGLNGIPVTYTLPSLVQHVAPDASLVGNPTLAGGRHRRVAAAYDGLSANRFKLKGFYAGGNHKPDGEEKWAL